MKISKRLILKVAEDLLNRRGTFTQEDVHNAIERRLGRILTVNEKRRITAILRNEYTVERTERDRERGNQRIFYFL